jgi:hypothetical protein
MSGRCRPPPGRARWLPVLVALAGALLAGCGIPAGTDVRVDGPLPEAGSPEAGGSQEPPPGPDQARSAAELVESFLFAAAGNPEEPVELLREFIHPDQRDAWQPDPQILVVRADPPLPTPGVRRERVQVSFREIGVLTVRGTFEPRDVPETREIPFEVVEDTEVTTDQDVGQRVGQPRYRLVDPPDEILLSADALDRYLLPRPVYFWGSDGETMVPDLRWLPSALADRQRPQKVLEWLADGPAPWLPGALVGLPDDVALAGNVVWSERRLEVSLTAGAGDVAWSQLDAQLWWTLRPELSGRTLVLNVDGQPREVDAAQFLIENPAVRPAPARFAVVDGMVRQQRPDQELGIPALDGVNQDIHSAALTRDRRFAALVRAEPDGKLRLAIARPAGERSTDLVATRMGRPMWLPGGNTGLVVAGGQLHRFGRDRATPEVRVPGDLAGIQAVATAPDGRRIALVANGRLYVASMVWRDGSFSVNEPRVLPTTAENLEGVGFLQENWLAFVGEAPDGRGLQLYEITVDGALERDLPSGDIGVPVSIDNFTAYPGDPTGQPVRGEIMYEFENQAYRYAYGHEQVPIGAGDLYGVPLDSEPGEPRAPFFLD